MTQQVLTALATSAPTRPFTLRHASAATVRGSGGHVQIASPSGEVRLIHPLHGDCTLRLARREGGANGLWQRLRGNPRASSLVVELVLVRPELRLAFAAVCPACDALPPLPSAGSSEATDVSWPELHGLLGALHACGVM
jgi:hypothetical protein